MGWSTWGRWIVFVVIVIFFALLVFCCMYSYSSLVNLCQLTLAYSHTSRRRHRAGLKPYHGMAWLGRLTAGRTLANSNEVNNTTWYNGAEDAPVTTYSSAYPGSQNRDNKSRGPLGRFTGQQNGEELLKPSRTYQPHHSNPPPYSVPFASPPDQSMANDGIIR